MPTPDSTGNLPVGRKGRVGRRSPANIALVKYWGKRPVQLPQNPSVSMTLTNCATQTYIAYEVLPSPLDAVPVDFYFDGEPSKAFGAKVREVLNNLADREPRLAFLKQLYLTVETSNTFPHSAGIASSASSMSALACCIADIYEELFNRPFDLTYISYLARLGSGSASRSVYPGWAVWGPTDLLPETSYEHAVPYNRYVHTNFRDFCDTVLIISSQVKKVSSRAGHALMENHPYAENRYHEARQNTDKLLQALNSGNLNGFGTIVEREALSLHALMMMSDPYFILMAANSLTAIERIRKFRTDNGVHVFFTMDAGPNVHVLYPETDRVVVRQFIDDQLADLCENGRYIHDKAGQGPERIT